MTVEEYLSPSTLNLLSEGEEPAPLNISKGDVVNPNQPELRVLYNVPYDSFFGPRSRAEIEIAEIGDCGMWFGKKFWDGNSWV